MLSYCLADLHAKRHYASEYKGSGQGVSVCAALPRGCFSFLCFEPENPIEIQRHEVLVKMAARAAHMRNHVSCYDT